MAKNDDIDGIKAEYRKAAEKVLYRRQERISALKAQYKALFRNKHFRIQSPLEYKARRDNIKHDIQALENAQKPSSIKGGYTHSHDGNLYAVYLIPVRKIPPYALVEDFLHFIYPHYKRIYEDDANGRPLKKLYGGSTDRAKKLDKRLGIVIEIVCRNKGIKLASLLKFVKEKLNKSGQNLSDRSVYRLIAEAKKSI